MSQNSAKPSLIHAVFLVSGTSIGAGMLAQPVASSMMGFIPSTIMMAVSWAFMAATALVLVEVCLWMQKDTHVISMANHFLGPAGKAVAWLIYLFMAYLSLTAYISGGGDLLKNAVSSSAFSNLPSWAYCVAFVLLFGIVLEVGNKAVSWLNTFLFALLVIAYVLVVGIGIQGIQLDNLAAADFSKSYVIVPLLLASFSFQMIVPSLVGYMKQDRSQVRRAILIGTGISFIIYVLWNAIVLGHESSLGNEALAEAYAKGLPPTQILSGSERSWFSFSINSFSFFALVTSFIGISWGLFDFLADGLKIRKEGANRLLLWVLVVSVPLLLASTYPQGFIAALESTGAYGDTILNAIIPVLMFWVGYHMLKKPSSAQILRNKPVLLALIAFAFAVIAYEVYQQVGPALVRLAQNWLRW